MKKPVDLDKAAAELSAIRHLMQQPGWVVLCARHELGVKQLTDQVLDANVDDVTATRLRHARACVLALSPEKLAASLESKLSAQLTKAAQETPSTT